MRNAIVKNLLNKIYECAFCSCILGIKSHAKCYYTANYFQSLFLKVKSFSRSDSEAELKLISLRLCLLGEIKCIRDSLRKFSKCYETRGQMFDFWKGHEAEMGGKFLNAAIIFPTREWKCSRAEVIG